MVRDIHLQSSGFSLIELVLVIVVLSSVAAYVSLSVSSSAEQAASTQADLFRRNLAHLQLLALSRSQHLQLAVASGNYTVTACDSSGCAISLTDPATGSAFSVNLPSGVSFSNGTGNYFFDSMGRPVTSATGTTLRTTSMAFTLNGGSHSVSVSVLPITGLAQ